jgi:hypothetical protein
VRLFSQRAPRPRIKVTTMIESLSTLANGDLLAHVFRAEGLHSYRLAATSKAAQYAQGVETPEGRMDLENVVGQFQTLERTNGLAILRA